MKIPKAPKATAQEKALERRQTMMLDEEISDQEQRFKAMARGKLGQASLLGGAPRNRGEAAGGGRAAASGAGAKSGGSLVGGIPGFSGAGGYGANSRLSNVARK